MSSRSTFAKAMSGVALATTLGIVHLLGELRLVVEVEYGDAVLPEEVDEVLLVHPRDLCAVAKETPLVA